MRYVFCTTKGYRGRLSILFFLVLLGTITGVLFPYIIGEIIDQFFYQKQMKGFFLKFSLYVGLYFINQCSHGMLNYMWAHLRVTYVVDIRKLCFIHLLKLKASVWTSIQSGDVMKRITDDAEAFLNLIHQSLFYIFANILQLGISIGYMLHTNLWLGLVAIVMTPVMSYSIHHFSVKLKENFQILHKELGLVEAWILEMMTGIKQWKLLNAQNKVQMDYKNRIEVVIKEEISAGYLDLEAKTVNEGLTLIGQLCIYCFSALFIARDTITVGQLVACLGYFSTCATYFNAVGKKITDINTNLVSCKRVEEFMGWEEEQDYPWAEDSVIRKGNISFENVTFGYGDELILRNLNLKINAGEKVALVGRSGEGKSTLLQLLYRFYEPISGRIYVDDKYLTAYTLESLRSQIAVVQQDTGLFHGSLRENIILSDDRSHDKRIGEILAGLKLTEIIEEFPEGLDTIVGSSGRELSGGQKQRVAIARCIYQQPVILLLDEATSALDEATERIVNAYIFEELPQTTILMVAHRFTTVLAAEKAAVIEQGTVRSIGTHDILMQQNELYRMLFKEYQKSFQSKNEGENDE